MKKWLLSLVSVFMINLLLTAPAIASIEIDKLKYELVQSLKDEQYSQALQLIKTLRAKKIPLGNEIIYFEAKAHLMTGNQKAGESLLRKYIGVAKGKGENYQRAIGMIIDIDNNRNRQIKAQQKEKADSLARKQSIAKEKSRVFGKIVSVNKEWGYVVAEIKTNIEPNGKHVFSRIDEFKTIAFKLGSSKGGKTYSLTTDEISNVSVGDVLYFNN